MRALYWCASKFEKDVCVCYELLRKGSKYPYHAYQHI